MLVAYALALFDHFLMHLKLHLSGVSIYNILHSYKCEKFGSALGTEIAQFFVFLLTFAI